MIKETAILDERRIVRVSEDPDFGVGQDKPADQIVLQITFERATERFFGQTSPRFARDLVLIESLLHFLF